MNKMNAVTELFNRECDSISHGPSTYILHIDTVVNKKSKKAISMDKLGQEDWEIHVDPKWHDKSASWPILCMAKNDSNKISLISGVSEENKLIDCFGESEWGVDEATPVEYKDIEKYLINGGPKKRVTKKSQKAKNNNPIKKDIEEKEDTVIKDEIVEVIGLPPAVAEQEFKFFSLGLTKKDFPGLVKHFNIDASNIADIVGRGDANIVDLIGDYYRDMGKKEEVEKEEIIESTKEDAPDLDESEIPF